MLHVALNVGSTRPARFADVAARWIVAGAAGRRDFKARRARCPRTELAVLQRTGCTIYTEGHHSEPGAESWQGRIGGYIATLAEARGTCSTIWLVSSRAQRMRARPFSVMP